MTTRRPIFPNGLRVGDLIAKTAGVTLKDTMRVMLAVDAVSIHYNVDVLHVLASCNYEPSRPMPESVAACEQAAFSMSQQDKADKGVIRRLRKIKALSRKT